MLYFYSHVFCWMQTDSEIKVRLLSLLLFTDIFFFTKQGNRGRALARQMSNDNYITVPLNIKKNKQNRFSFIHTQKKPSTLEKLSVVSRLGGMGKKIR